MKGSGKNSGHEYELFLLNEMRLLHHLQIIVNRILRLDCEAWSVYKE